MARHLFACFSLVWFGYAALPIWTPNAKAQAFDVGRTQAKRSNIQPVAWKQTKELTTSAPLGNPESTGSAWLRPMRSAASRIKDTFTFKPKVVVPADPTSLGGPKVTLGAEVFLSAAALQETRGNIQGALDAYRAALKHEPENRRAALGLARLQQRTGNQDAAIQTYRGMLTKHPEDPVLWNDIALCYAQSGRTTEAIQAIGNAVKYDPNNLMYRNNSASIFVDAGRTNDALAALQQAHGPAAGHHNLAFLLTKRGDIRPAMYHVEQALRIDPQLQPARALYNSLNRELNPQPAAPRARTAQAFPVRPVAWVTEREVPVVSPAKAQPAKTPTVPPLPQPLPEAASQRLTDTAKSVEQARVRKSVRVDAPRLRVPPSSPRRKAGGLAAPWPSQD